MSAMRPLPRLVRLATGLVRQAVLGRVPRLFDEGWYLRQNPGLARSGLDPFLHYVLLGARAGRDPATDFDTAFYRGQSGRTRLDPVRHYLTVGAREGLDPNPSFSTSLYLARYPDVAKAGINPLLHYRTDGRAEGREAAPSPRAGVRLPALDDVPPEYRLHLPDTPKGRFSLHLLRGFRPAPDDAFAPRLCLQLNLDGTAYEAVIAALRVFETGPQDAIVLEIDAGAGLQPPVPTQLLAFERCVHRRSPDGRAVHLRYAELRVWDLRGRRPAVAAVFPAGCFSAHGGPGGP